MVYEPGIVVWKKGYRGYVMNGEYIGNPRQNVLLHMSWLIEKQKQKQQHERQGP